MKKTLFLAIAVTLMVCSCGTAKKASSSQTYERSTQVTSTTPYSANQPEQQIRVSSVAQQAIDDQGPVSIEMIDFGFGRSGDKAKALRDALKSAQNNIAIRLYRSISSVDKEFAEDITLGDKITTQTKRADMIVGIVDSKTATISYTTAPTFSRENGVYECQVEVKLMPELLHSITKDIYNSLSADDELKVRFNEQQFYDNVYKQELEAYRAANGNKQFYSKSILFLPYDSGSEGSVFTAFGTSMDAQTT